MTTTASINSTNSNESDRDNSIATDSIKEHSAMSGSNTSALDKINVPMKMLNSGNDDDAHSSSTSIVTDNHLLRLRNDVSVQEEDVARHPQPDPISGVIRSSSEVDLDLRSARVPVSEEEDNPVSKGSRVNDGRRGTAHDSARTHCSLIRPENLSLPGNVRRNICSDVRLVYRSEVNTDEENGPPSKKEKGLVFVREYKVNLRDQGRFENIGLCAVDGRRLQMLTFPGTLTAGYKFLKRVYMNPIKKSMVYCFLSEKYSAYIQVTDDESVRLGDDQARDRDPKDGEQFVIAQDTRQIEYIRPLKLKDSKYLAYDTVTFVARLSDEKFGFLVGRIEGKK